MAWHVCGKLHRIEAFSVNCAYDSGHCVSCVTTASLSACLKFKPLKDQ